MEYMYVAKYQFWNDISYICGGLDEDTVLKRGREMAEEDNYPRVGIYVTTIKIPLVD